MNVPEHIEGAAGGFFAELTERPSIPWIPWIPWIPSISADPQRRGDARRSAEWPAGHLRASGAPVVVVWETEGLPAVYAKGPAGAPDAPRVLVAPTEKVEMPPLLKGAAAAASRWEDLAGGARA